MRNGARTVDGAIDGCVLPLQVYWREAVIRTNTDTPSRKPFISRVATIAGKLGCGHRGETSLRFAANLIKPQVSQRFAPPEPATKQLSNMWKPGEELGAGRGAEPGGSLIQLAGRGVDSKPRRTDGGKGTVTESHLPQRSRQGDSRRQRLLHLQQIVKVRLSQYSRNSGPQDILSM